MFDIGFWELTVVGVVALLVLGPERLPTVARTAGLWFGKARGMVASVKADIDRELKADELKRIMEEQARSTGVYEMVEETRASLNEVKGGLESIDKPVEVAEKPSSAAAEQGAVAAQSAEPTKSIESEPKQSGTP